MSTDTAHSSRSTDPPLIGSTGGYCPSICHPFWHRLWKQLHPLAIFELIRENMVALCKLYAENGYACAKFDLETQIHQGIELHCRRCSGRHIKD